MKIFSRLIETLDTGYDKVIPIHSKCKGFIGINFLKMKLQYLTIF